MAKGGGAWIDPCVPASTARASARVSQATASSSVWSGAALSWVTSAIRPIISWAGKGQGWLE